MIYKLYSMKDRLTHWQPAIPFMNEEAALRYFESVMNNTLEMKDHPQDYDMYQIGTWDNESGTIIGITPELKWRGDEINIGKN